MSILKRTAPALLLLASLQPPAHAQDNPRVPAHTLYAADGTTKAAEGPITLGIIGNTRGSLRGLDSRSKVSGVTQSLIADMTAQASSLDVLVMMGDHVQSGNVVEWRRFHNRFEALLADSDSSSSGTLPAIVVAGDRESLGDERLANWGSAFPGVGVDIGYSRVASWYGFDIDSDGHTWRILVLDSGKDRLGSRWNEQLSWLSEEAAGRFDSLIVLMHEPLLDLSGGPMNRDGAPLELLETIEESTSLLKIRAVITAGSHANQVMLPDGPFGSLYLNAGGGGAPAMDLRRWGAAEAAGRSEDIHLEAMFDLALLSAFSEWSTIHNIPEAVMSQAQASGSFEGFVGSLTARYMPTYGWWTMSLEGSEASVLFRHRMPNGDIEDRYRVHLHPEAGWKGSSSP